MMYDYNFINITIFVIIKDFLMTKKQKAEKIISLLKEEYPEVKCALTYSQPHELLIATRLSAQCTDKRVNMVTPDMFRRFPTIKAFADAEVSEIEDYIKSCGLYKTKAKDIAQMCKILHDKYNDIVPDTIDELVKLPGVGRKTANLICGDLYGKPAYVCDTHVIRLTNKLGLSEGKDAFSVEKQLMKIVPPEESLNFCHRLVWHGRLVCNARKPACENCRLSSLCSSCSKK